MSAKLVTLSNRNSREVPIISFARVVASVWNSFVHESVDFGVIRASICEGDIKNSPNGLSRLKPAHTECVSSVRVLEVVKRIESSYT